MLILVAAVCACYAYFVHLPAREEYANLKSELDEVERELAEANSLPSRLADARRLRDETLSFIQDWKEVTPSSSEAGSFGAVIAQLVTSSGARMDRMLPVGEIPYESMVQVPITIEFDGYFDQLFRVLSQLEAREESIWIDELIVAKQEEQSSPRLHCMIKLAVFADKSEISD